MQARPLGSYLISIMIDSGLPLPPFLDEVAQIMEIDKPYDGGGRTWKGEFDSIFANRGTEVLLENLAECLKILADPNRVSKARIPTFMRVSSILADASRNGMTPLHVFPWLGILSLSSSL